MGLVWSLQAEWQYLLQVSPHTAMELVPVEEALMQEFIPALFGRRMEVTTNDRILYTNSVKAGGLDIRDPCHEAGSLNETSKAASKLLVTALVEGTDLSLVGHKKTVRAASTEARTAKKEEEKLVVAERKARINTKEKK